MEDTQLKTAAWSSFISLLKEEEYTKKPFIILRLWLVPITTTLSFKLHSLVVENIIQNPSGLLYVGHRLTTNFSGNKNIKRDYAEILKSTLMSLLFIPESNVSLLRIQTHAHANEKSW